MCNAGKNKTKWAVRKLGGGGGGTPGPVEWGLALGVVLASQCAWVWGSQPCCWPSLSLIASVLAKAACVSHKEMLCVAREQLWLSTKENRDEHAPVIKKVFLVLRFTPLIFT